MFKVLIISQFRTPRIYEASNLSFARTLASPCYGETGYIYEGNNSHPLETLEYKAAF